MKQRAPSYRLALTCSPHNKQPYTYKLRVPISRIWQSVKRVYKEIKGKPENRLEANQHNKQPYTPKRALPILRFGGIFPLHVMGLRYGDDGGVPLTHPRCRML